MATLEAHLVGLVAPLVLARPPDARSLALAGRVDPVVAVGVLAERDPAESARFLRLARVVELDVVLASRAQPLRKVNEHRVDLALVLQLAPGVQDAVDVQVGIQIELDARIVAQHPETDGVLSGEVLLLGIDADVEVVREEIVVGAVASVVAAQEVGARRRPERGRLLVASGAGPRPGCEEKGQSQRRESMHGAMIARVRLVISRRARASA
jgi:hypothetical protein